MPLADLTTLVNATAQNLSQLKGLSIAYNLLGGAPTIAGYTSLINGNNSTNFGAGAGVTFNDENVYINVLNALYQGNADAKTAFDAIVNGGATLADKLELVYNTLIPASARSDAGLTYFKGQAAFYEARAVELGVAGDNGAALVAYAGLAKIAVDNDIGGLGDTVNDLVAAVKNGTAVLPEDGSAFTPLEDADGTGFDVDDVSTSTGTPLSLTVGTDNLVGTAGDDTITGSTGAAASATNTFTTGDTVDGGGGTDTLNLALTTGAGPFIPVLKSVENINVTDTVGTGINMINSTGTMNFKATGNTATTVITNQNAIAGLEIESASTGGAGFNLGYTAATVAGTSDVQSLKLSNNGTAATAIGTVTIGGVETVNAMVSGVNNIGTLALAQTTGINVEGSGSLTVGTALGTALKSFDASKATGAQSIVLGADAGVAVKGGTAADLFNFAATFTSKDTVDGGDGLDTVRLAGGNFSAAANDTLKGLNAITKVETIGFDTNGTTLDMDTFSNADVKTVQFNAAGADTVTNAKAGTLFDFGGTNGGAATFTMKGGETTLNVSLSGTAAADADIGGLNTGTATTVNIASNGTFNTGTVPGGNTNDLGAVTNATNATFKITGDAATTASSFSNAVILDATGSTGNLFAVGSGVDDFVKGSSGINAISAGNGFDQIDITKSDAKVDTIDLSNILLSANRDTVTGFKAGAGGDLIMLDQDDTTAGTVGVGTFLAPTSVENPIVQQQVAAGASTVLAGSDILEFAFNATNPASLGDGSANALNGTNLLLSVGTIAAAADQNTGYLIAYQGGNAYLYHYAESNDAGVDIAAGDIQLVGTFNGVAVGGLEAGNFDLIA